MDLPALPGAGEGSRTEPALGVPGRGRSFSLVLIFATFCLLKPPGSSRRSQSWRCHLCLSPARSNASRRSPSGERVTADIRMENKSCRLNFCLAGGSCRSPVSWGRVDECGRRFLVIIS